MPAPGHKGAIPPVFEAGQDLFFAGSGFIGPVTFAGTMAPNDPDRGKPGELKQRG